jgi:hypothetical protein
VAWDEIERVLGRKKDGRTEIELRTMDDMSLLLRSDWAGFGEVMRAMATSLPHLAPERLANVGLLRPGHALWRRGWTIGAEAVGADGMLDTAWVREPRDDGHRQP